MPKINRSLLVKYSPEQMYNLVNNLENYAEFLPWCTSTQTELVGAHQKKATVCFSHSVISQSFSTLNTLEPYKSISMELVEGPFKNLSGLWRFEDQGTGCLLSLDLDFEFASPLMRMAAGPIFHKGLSSMIEAFSQRAQSLYD